MQNKLFLKIQLAKSFQKAKKIHGNFHKAIKQDIAKIRQAYQDFSKNVKIHENFRKAIKKSDLPEQ